MSVVCRVVDCSAPTAEGSDMCSRHRLSALTPDVSLDELLDDLMERFVYVRGAAECASNRCLADVAVGGYNSVKKFKARR